MVFECDDGVLVYDERAGRTHLLDFAAWQALEAVWCRDGGAITEAELRTVLGIHETSASGHDLLRALEAAALIERCSV